MAKADSGPHPLAPICATWLRKIEDATQRKWEVFGQYAQEISNFYDGPADWMWKQEYATGPRGFLDKANSNALPMFRMTVNKPFEAVALFGPVLMHRYPQVTVSPTEQVEIDPRLMGLDENDPAQVAQVQMELQQEAYAAALKQTTAAMNEHYLNWAQVMGKKKLHSRRGIGEAIVKGLGVLWTEMYEPRGAGVRFPVSRFVSCDDIQKDPDAEYAEDVQWLARRCVHPLNIVARKYGIPEEELKGHLQSYESQSTKRGKKEAKSGQKGQSYDLLTYWEVYSKNGFGHRLRGVTDKRPEMDLDWLGDFCYLAVAKDIPYPLNLPSWTLAEGEDAIFQRAQWPIPFYLDDGAGNGWPTSELHFADKMNCVWPLSLMKPALGEIRFVNWCMSFLADKVAQSATTYIAVAKAAGMEIQNQLVSGLAPFTQIEISDILGKSVADVVSFLQAPNFSSDIWTMVAQVLELIDKRTGLTELMYGLSRRQMRSATEANVREQNLSVRPDDMSERTDDWYSHAALKEIAAIYWAGERQDVEGVLGPRGAQLFEQIQMNGEFEKIVKDYAYRVVSGSAKKPDKVSKQESLTQIGQVVMPMLQFFAQSGNPGPWNAYVSDLAEAMDVKADAYLVQPPPPQEGPSPEEVQAQMEQQKAELDMAAKQQDMRLQAAGEQHSLRMEHMKGMQELLQDAAVHNQEMRQTRQKQGIELDFLKKKTRLQLAATGRNGK